MALVIILVVPLLSFLPGLLLISCRGQKSGLDEEEKIAFSFGISLIVIGLIQFTTFIIGISAGAINIALYVSVLVILFLIIRMRKIKLYLPKSIISPIFLIYLLYNLSLLYLTPSYNTAFWGDYSLYYPFTEIFLRGRHLPSLNYDVHFFEYFLKRPPLFNLAGSFFMSLFGRSYANYQVITTFFNSLLFWAIFCLAKRLFNRTTALYSVLLLAITPIFIRSICTPTPKMMATYYVIMAYIAYLKIRNKIQRPPDAIHYLLFAGFFCAAYMTHPSMLFYLIPLLFDRALVCFKQRTVDVAFLLYILSGVIVIVLPWKLWIVGHYGLSAVFSPTITIGEN